jgi:hypothetical protein
MPVMMTSSGECCLAREGPLALFDFLIFWPGDLRGFMNWMVALQVQPPLSVLDGPQVFDFPSRQWEIQIVYRAPGR